MHARTSIKRGTTQWKRARLSSIEHEATKRRHRMRARPIGSDQLHEHGLGDRLGEGIMASEGRVADRMVAGGRVASRRG